MKSNHCALVFPVLLLLGSFNIAQTQQTPEKTAQLAAETWLRLMDSRKYPEAWDEASQLLKAKISRRAWEMAFRDFDITMKNFPVNKSRKLVKAEAVKLLPSMPNLKGVVIKYKISFEGHEPIDEIVELVLEKDNEWRIAYYNAIGTEPVLAPLLPSGVPGSQSPVETSGDTKPVLLNYPAPIYTDAALNNKTQGRIRVRILIGEDGRVKRATIVKGLPDGLNEMALKAAYKMEFRPAMKNGQPVAYWLNNVTMGFSIPGK